jgi:hypothetical protein
MRGRDCRPMDLRLGEIMRGRMRNWRRWRSRCRGLSTRNLTALFAAARGHPKMEPQIIQPADHRNPPRGESYFGTSGEN